jgi:arylsulfatase A-like enzyme
MNRLTRREFLKQAGMTVPVLGCLAAGVPGCRGPGKGKKPSIICFIMDDSDFGFFGCYGGDGLTPNLDNLASEGVRFTGAFCSSAACTPSRYSLLTGRYAGRCSHTDFLEENPRSDICCITWNTFLDDSVPTVVSLLSSRGYYTGMAGKWHLSPPLTSRELPAFDPGEEPDNPDAGKRLATHQKVIADAVRRIGGFDYAAGVLWENGEQLPLKKLRHHHLEWITRGALDFLDTCPEDRPFFLYFATTAVHGPSLTRSIGSDPANTPAGRQERHLDAHPPRRSIRERLENAGRPFSHRHAGMVWVDDQVGALTRKLREMGRDRDTLILILADHNTEPGKCSCYDKGVRIPMILRWPARVSPGRIVDTPVQVVDIFSTLLDAAEVKVPEDLRVDGRSFLAAAVGAQVPARSDLYFEYGYTRAVRTERYKYVAFRYPVNLIHAMKCGILEEAPNHLNMPSQGQPYITMKYFPAYFEPDQLYDLEKDPYEQNNLAGDPGYAYILAEMKERLRRYLKSMDHPFDLDVPAFMRSPDYRALTERTRRKGTGWIGWWQDTFQWPHR